MLKRTEPDDPTPSFGHDTRGSIAIKFALALPALAVISLGAIDLNAVHSEKSRLQDIADSAALAGGRELALAVDELGPVKRAETFVLTHLAEWDQAPAIVPDIKVITMAGDVRALRVNLAGRRPSFFGNLLPPGGWALNVSAVASPVSIAPLCVLTTGAANTDTMRLRNTAVMDAPVCLVHSNQTVVAGGTSRIRAATTQAVTTARGDIQRAPQEGAPAIDDPYMDLDPSPPSTCGEPRQIRITASRTLSPGVHCDDLLVSRNAVLTLAPGEHYFVGTRLAMTENSRLNGSNVVLVFDQASFDFLGRSRITLSGRRDGRLAGFVIIGLRPPDGWCPTPPAEEEDEPGDDDEEGDDDDEEADFDEVRPRDCRLGSEFLMASDNVEKLEGVIYFPVAKLIVEGTDRIAEASDWTVMVVEGLEIRGSPTLVINADYAGAVVPVPQGVGPDGAVQLVK